VLRASDNPEAWSQADVWAPEVVYRNGKFYLYYTASRKSDDWRVGEMALAFRPVLGAACLGRPYS
jgi:beta-xylosidase